MKVLKRKGLLKLAEEPVKEEPKKQRKNNTDNKLPSDEYRDEIEPKEIILNGDGKLVVSVKRGGAYGLPRVDIRFYATTEVYTGFTKKGINVDLNMLPDLIEKLKEAEAESEEKELFEEFDE